MQGFLGTSSARFVGVLIAAALLAVPAGAVSVSADSAAGWTPSDALEAQAEKTALDFLAAKDGGRYAQAYGLMAQAGKAGRPLTAFARENGDFNRKAGAVKDRRIVKVTWTKDPAPAEAGEAAPAAGVYVEVDLISHFARIDRHCGYLVLYQAPEGGAFAVLREESTYISPSAAHAKDVARTWALVSARCPNYPGEGAR